MGRIEDVGKRPRKLRNASKHTRERSERRNPGDSPRRTPEELEDPGGETLMPGGVHNVQEGPRKVKDERVDGTDAPCRDTGPGRDLEVQEESKGVEVDRDRQKVVEAPDTMENVPGPRETSAASIRTRHVEIEGREAIEARRRCREVSRTIGSAITMATASRWKEKVPDGWRNERRMARLETNRIATG